MKNELSVNADLSFLFSHAKKGCSFFTKDTAACGDKDKYDEDRTTEIQIKMTTLLSDIWP